MSRLIIPMAICVILACTAVFAQAAQTYISVISTYPANGATLVDPTISDIMVQCNTTSSVPLDASSFTGLQQGRISVNNSANYTTSLSGYNYIDIKLNANLHYSTTYTVTINYRVQDINGDQLGPNNQYTYTFQFTTMPNPGTIRPTVSFTSPAGGAINVPVTQAIGITFSEPMAVSTINTSNITLVNNSTGASVAGTVTLADNVATFQPSSNLSSFTTYTATVTTGVTNIAGLHMSAPYSWQFTTISTDTTAPTVLGTSPGSNATGVDPSTTVYAWFSKAMNNTTITASTFYVNGVSGTVTYYPTGTSGMLQNFLVAFTPSVPLANATTYTVTITTGVTDQSGNHLASNKTWTFTTASAVPPPPLNDYAQVPSFITNTANLLPNVLLMVDNSGSMYEFAYKNKADSRCSDYGNNCYDNSYNPAYPGGYYGYFDNTQMYAYSSNNGGYFYIDTTAGLNTNSFWSGNFLNWLTMRRVDIIRKVLVGGKTQPRSANTANYLIPAEDPDRDYYKTYSNVYYTIQAGASKEVIFDTTHNTSYNLQVYVGNQPPQDGLILNYSNRIRFGIEYFNYGDKFEDSNNSSRDGGNIAVNIGATGNNLITQIETTNPSTWTPLSESLYEAIRYFEATTSAYNGGTYSGQDPIQYPCQNNFVLILTDGESTMDENVPGTSFSSSRVSAVTDPNFNVQTWMTKISNNELNANAGYVNQKSVSANTMGGTYYLEGVAYYAHTTDLRSDLSGRQNLTIYTVFAFDDSPIGSDILQKTSKYGGFTDMENDGIPFTDCTCYPATRGVNGCSSVRNPKCNEWNSGYNSDSSRDGIPDTFYAASDGSSLETSLTNAFNSMLAKTCSGTAASILSSSSGTGANILQAMFYPQKYFGDTAVSWIGELHSLWFYVDPFLFNSTVREDNEYSDTTRQASHYLDLSTDRVIDFSFDTASSSTVVNRSTDALGDGKPDLDTNGDGIPDSYTPYDTNVSPDNIFSIWKAGLLLLSRSPDSRSIYTQLNGSLVDFNYRSTGNTLDIGTYLDTTSAAVRSYLMAANSTEANKIIDFTRGIDQNGYRSRTVTQLNAYTGQYVTGVWKLGDIISSTPKQQTTYQLDDYDQVCSLSNSDGYGDTSYSAFYNQPDYQKRGMVYVGVNDGMLHAFKMGKLGEMHGVYRKASLSGPYLGDEQWAFIPRNALPYLRYLADPNYTGLNHLYLVDGPTVIKDVSIGIPSACGANNYSTTDYSQCDKDYVNGTNYRTVLVGSMGLGGASSIQGSGCKTTSTSPTVNGTCVETPTTDPLDPTKGLGYSSYFALDITNQSFNSSGDTTLVNKPKLLWEFSDPALGYSMSGAAIVHISAKDSNNTPITSKNGKWFAVLASGPTGAIDTTGHQFQGTSNQPLTIFVLDLATGAKLATINTLADGTQLTNAFAGSLTLSVVDSSRIYCSTQYPTFYSDDALLFGYVQNGTSGGVLRLTTNGDPNPQNWKLSKVIDGIGPVTANIGRLRLRKADGSGDFWLYFGTGRYFYTGDDMSDQQLLVGLKEPCYRQVGQSYGFDYSCTTKLAKTDLVDQTSGNATVSTTNKGWLINLAQANSGGGIGAERDLSDPVTVINGLVLFTTFAPSTAVCGFSGQSYIWGVNWNTGGAPMAGATEARVLLQLSTGSIAQVDLAGLTANNGRTTPASSSLTGKPPGDSAAVLTKAANKPVKKIIHIQER